MNNKVVIGIIIAVILVVGVVALNANQRNDASETVEEGNGQVPNENENNPTEENGGVAEEENEVIISMTKNGFTPKDVTVKKGTEVTFKNMGTIDQWPATAIHPTHRVYPESDIKKCGTAEAEIMFDACEGIKPGESYSFTFNEVGTWRYHDHLNATLFGSVIVEE